ncbi:hypothetical protein M5X00_13430 [Paenibacillus alvei]|nr:hypothetical protein [Paenibacillus alvei]MCY9708321.1 hypothetical protein [Paenibacillus alvei]MCY9732991.1 hypothetical protein [Paenibacillus alvei]MCY9755243.1 hypothetical protein [Paenibacillus alvei]MEC0080279.1 hypothetical protein [Paenibacillus alvei]
MFGIISSPENHSEIKDAVGAGDIWVDKVGSFTPETFIQHCQAAAAVQIQTLIIDAGCTDDSTLIKGVRQYRLKRDLTRIVVICPGREPGDTTINTLLKFQVYDFVAPRIEMLDTYESEEDDDEDDNSENEEELVEIQRRYPLSYYIEQQLRMPSSYANAARWDTGTDYYLTQEKTKNESNNDKEPKVVQKSIDPSLIEEIQNIEILPPPIKERHTLVETIFDTITIAVIGVESNVCTTHTALLISNFLNDYDYKVGIVEANDKRDFEKMEYAYEGMKGYKSEQRSFSINEVDYYKTSSTLDMAHLKEKAYDYLILDLGSYEKCKYIEEFRRASVHVVVGHGSEWRQQKIFEFNKAFENSDRTKWIYCIPFGDELTLKDIKKEIGLGIVVSLPAHPNPWEGQKDTESILYSFLQDYLGQRRSMSKTKILYGVIIIAAIIIIILLLLLFTK